MTASEVPPAEAVVEEEGARRVPTAVIVVGIAVLSAVGGAFTVLSRRNHRQPVRREEQPRRKRRPTATVPVTETAKATGTGAKFSIIL